MNTTQCALTCYDYIWDIKFTHAAKASKGFVETSYLKVVEVGKKEAGVSSKTSEEIVEEVEEFKHFGVWVDRKL